MSDKDPRNRDPAEDPAGSAAFEAVLASRLEDEREALPPEVRERLGAMRREAVALAEAGQSEPLLRRWFGGLSLATTAAAGLALVLAIGVWLTVLPADGPEPLPAITETEAAVMQDLELLEDLEFIAWLEEESAGAG